MSSFVPFTCYIKVSLPPQVNKWEDFWLQIHGYWLIISKKIGEHAHFLLPLDLQQLASGEPDTGVQNCILLEVSKYCGSHKIYISSTSRIEIILLFQALNVGYNVLKNLFQGGKLQEDVECDYKASSGFMNLSRHTGKILLTRDELSIGGKEKYPISSIVSMSAKQNDVNCHHRLVLVIENEGVRKHRELHVTSIPVNLMRMTGAFLMRKKALERDK